MTNLFARQRINKDLKTITSQFKDAYRISCDSSRNAYMRTLAPGSPVPKEGIIYGDDYRREFESMCAGYQDRAQTILKDALEDLVKIETEAPSTEAVNSITLLKMRDDITEKEIDNLLTKYGDNPQAWRALVSIARDHKIRTFPDHPVYTEIENIENLGANIEKTLTLRSAEQGHAEGYISFLDAMIDGAFPTE